MTKVRSTKKSLTLSILSLVLCFSMLIGSTFAWFTDSVTSANNVITSGKLDVELYYQVEGQTDWTKVTEQTNVFKENALWEPGYTEVVKFKVVNEGNLALKYNLGVNVASEVGSVNVNGNEFLLSDYIKFAVIDGAQNYNRDQAVAAAEETGATALKTPHNSGAKTLLKDEEAVVTMVVYMPESVGNDANAAKDAPTPTINLGINLFATQFTYEEDSFGNDYDLGGPIISTPVTRPESGNDTDTADLTLNGLEDVSIKLPGKLIDELPEEVEELSLAVSAPVMNTVENTITFPAIEVVDQYGEIIDLEALNTGIKVTVTIPAQDMFAPDTTVMIYHDGEYMATVTVNADTTITYEVDHLCEVTVGTTKAPVVDAEDENIIKISNVAELMGFAQKVNSGESYKGKTVVLTKDIDLNNVAWTPIGRIGVSSTDFTYAFKGTFDGQGHTISNLNVANTGWAGLFGIAHTATISNLKIKGATITSNRMAGAIVGQLYGSIDNCHVEEDRKSVV